nr:MBL fold metallo-hydrolase [Gemmatimonadales bacterium]
ITLWAIGRRNTRLEALRRGGWVLVGVAWVYVASTAWQPTDAASGLTLHFLDVGQGDAAVLRTPAGHWVLIDAGPVLGRDDAGRRVVLPFLQRHGVTRLAAVVISHAHADHVGGAAAVLARVPADAVIEPGRLYADPVYYRFLDAVATGGDPWQVARSGQHFAIDGVRFTVLHPDTTWTEWGTDLNEDSAVLLVDYGAFSALFAGDAGLPAERLMAGHAGRVDLLKVGHHGSRGASGDAWLEELRPRAAVISVGQRNRYGHPAAEALARLARHHAELWRTDREGTITVNTDGQRMTVRGHRGSVTYPVQ